MADQAGDEAEVAEVLGLRERTRRAVRAELMSVAMQLFLAQGFDETTVEQIAVTAGLSRRSFFRYFASKDEILAETLADTGHQIAAALSARPAAEEPWPALRRAFDPLLAAIAGDDRALAMTRMMLQSPALSSSHLDKQTSWRTSVASALWSRLAAAHGDIADDELSAEALAGAAMSCLTTAQTRWVRTDNVHSLPFLLDLSMNAVHPLPDITTAHDSPER